MSSQLRKILREITPPVIRRKINQVLRRNVEGVQIGTERDASWYDQAFLSTEVYNCAYYKSHYYFIWCVVVDRVIRSGAKYVLDIGCGPGQVARFLQDRGLPNYFGLDLSPVAVEKAQVLCPGYLFKAENALESSVYSDIPYDTVISLEFLEHVTEEIEVLKKLRKGIRFFGTVPDFPYPSHVRHFSSCAEVLERYGNFFDALTVDEFISESGGGRYFLLEGLKS